MGELRRFVRQLALSARMDLLVMVTSRAQATLWLVTDFVAYTAGITAVLLLAEQFDGIAGWSKPQIVFLMGFATTSAALRQMFFGYNVGSISRRIGRGQLDHTLVQPQSMPMSFATEGFSPFSSLGSLTPGVVLLVAGTRAADLAVTPGFVVRTALCLACSMVMVLAATFVVGSAAFWSPRGAEEISMRGSSLLQLTDFPLDPVPVVLRGLLLSVVPAGFVAWFPAGVLLGRRPLEHLLLLPAVAALAALVATMLFRKGLRHYAHTGSSRYSTFGHRR